VPNRELPESDSDVAARVTVEIRLRAVTEVNDGAPVGEVAERYRYETAEIELNEVLPVRLSADSELHI
jgi:hypothetical protein